MHECYVDVPTSYKYRYDDKVRLGSQALTRDFGIPFEFICNSLAFMSEGDLYKVKVADERAELLFLIKSGFTKLNNDVVERYIKSRRKYETNYRNPRR